MWQFKHLRRLLKMAINSPVRAVVVLPPQTVWRHLAAMSSDFQVNDPSMWGLLCFNPIYGLNDASLAWQLFLREYLQQIKGALSALDENSWRWKRPDGSPLAVTLMILQLQHRKIGWIDTVKLSWESSRRSAVRPCHSNTMVLDIWNHP